MTNGEKIKAKNSRAFAQWINRLLFARTAGECFVCPARSVCKDRSDEKHSCVAVIAAWLDAEAEA